MDKSDTAKGRTLRNNLDDSNLNHFGIKGMHWGIRRQRIPASDDSVRVSESYQRAKQGGAKALTTKELQDLVMRMNLEQQYSRLMTDNRKSGFAKGHGFVKTTLTAGKTMNEVLSFVNSPFGKLIRGSFNR